MASITKRGDAWFVRIVRKGHDPVRKTFPTKRDAEAFAATVEAEMVKGIYRRAVGENTTFRELVRQYRKEVTPTKRGKTEEDQRLNALLKPETAARSMLDKVVAALTPADVAAWRNKRGTEVAPATLMREWAIFSHVMEVARLEWGYAGLGNPFKGVRKPKIANQRDRRITSEELEAIVAATGSAELGAIIRLAVETGARRGELLGLCWRDVDLKRRVARLQSGATKNGHGRALPLSRAAVDLLGKLTRRLDGGVVFTLRPDSVTQAFRRAVQRARKQYEADCKAEGQQPDPGFLVGIKLHDTRHEACSRLAELGLSATELAAISGHRTIQLLSRYVHHRPEQLAQKLG